MTRSRPLLALHRLRELRHRRGAPVAFGALIAAAGLVLGGLATSYAADTDASVPTRGDSIPNVTQVESTIKAYYGAASASYPNIGSVTIPSRSGNYALEVARIQERAQEYLQGVLDSGDHGPNPALVFDIDDTTLNTYDYELYVNFAYTPDSNALFVNNKAFPSVYGMPALVNWADRHGFTVFFLTGRPEAQRSPTVGNLSDVGYDVSLNRPKVYLKQPTPPPYLSCSAAPNCTTIEYKSGTRAHIENDLGYDLVADFGDQYSDLDGGHAGKRFKMPNPMYFLP